MTAIHYSPRRFWAKVEKTPTCWNWTAAQLDGGYGQFSIQQDGRKRPVGAHRVAYIEKHGAIPEGLNIDHVCHNRLCVNPDHLRAVTTKQNSEHRLGGLPDSTSGGIRGVSWAKRQKRWHAKLRHNGRTVHIGYFPKMEDAEAAAIAKRNELFTHNDADRMATK